MKRPTWFHALAAVTLIALLLLAWNWSGMRAQAELGSAFGARITCSCRYVEGRTLDSCKDDKEPGMALVTLADDPERRSVKASVPLLAARTAHYRPGWGCLIDPAR